MNERVVYVLGAGFSAPLGVPVMRDFLSKSKDLYFANQSRFAYFAEVFSKLRAMAVAKNYYNCDLSNIEEVLSILEIDAVLEGNATFRSTYVKYLSDVVLASTPPMGSRQGRFPGNWQDFVFGDSPPWPAYGSFVASLLGLQVSLIGREEQTVRLGVGQAPTRMRYGIVTLNYDCIPETICEFLDANYNSSVSFADIESFKSDVWKDAVYLAKLHGSANSDSIIAPTWNKVLTSQFHLNHWQAAHRMLSNCNHIRFIGYSLPSADSYVRYLLKSAALNSEHLKTIDVLCLDPDGAVKARFDEFVDFRPHRFRSADVMEYLSRVRPSHVGPRDNKNLSYDALENVHSEVFA